MDEETRKLKADLLSGEILQMAYASLLLHLRFMENALSRLAFTPMPKGTVWTDGERYSYSPMHVLLRYKAEQTNPARDYLHSVLHCVFRHMYLHGRVEKEAWSLACDMVVEDLIADLSLRATAVAREEEQQRALAPFRDKVRPFTAEKLYRFLLDDPLPEDERLRLEELFRADDHRGWFSDEDNEERQNERDEESPDIPEPNAPPMETEQEWKDVSDAIEQRELDRELGLCAPDESELRRMFRLRYLKEGVCICGARETQRSYGIPAAIGGRSVVGVDTAAFYTPDAMPCVSRAFAADLRAPSIEGDSFLLGRAMERRGCAETPLAWRVLRREEGRALAVCERAVAVLPYHGELREVTWESCDLRHWLNGVFLPLCFTAAERERILPAAVETPDNCNFGTPGGARTEDYLFLPSAEEASALFKSDAERALGQWWWLRTPGFDNTFAATVTPDGAVVRIGSFVDTDDYAVRPAMWVKL